MQGFQMEVQMYEVAVMTHYIYQFASLDNQFVILKLLMALQLDYQLLAYKDLRQHQINRFEF